MSLFCKKTNKQTKRKQMRFLIFSKSLCVAGPDSTLQVPMQKNRRMELYVLSRYSERQNRKNELISKSILPIDLLGSPLPYFIDSFQLPCLVGETCNLKLN